MPSNENLRRLVHGGSNQSGGFTNTNSVLKPPNGVNGGHHDLEYYMPVLNSSTEVIPWANTHNCVAVNGQGASWNQDGSASGWGLKMYATGTSGYLNNYHNSTSYILAGYYDKCVYRMGAYFKRHSNSVGKTMEMYMFGVNASGQYNASGHGHGYATSNGYQYRNSQASEGAVASNTSTLNRPAGDIDNNSGTIIGDGYYTAGYGNRTYYSQRMDISTSWTWHEMYCYFNNPGFTPAGITARLGFRQDNGTWATNDQYKYCLIDKWLLEPVHISMGKAFGTLYGTNYNIKMSEIDDPTVAQGGGGGA